MRLHFLKLDREFFCLFDSRVLRGSILLSPRHPSVFARMARWQLISLSKINNIHMQNNRCLGVLMSIGSKGTVIEPFSAVTIGFVLPNTNRGNKR